MFAKTLKPFVFLVAVMTIVSLACLSPTGTQVAPSPVATEPPQNQSSQATESPATQPPAQPTAQATAQAFFTEEFDGEIPNWSKSVEKNNDTGDTSQANISIKDGALVFDLGKELIAYVFYDAFLYENVRIDARVVNRGTNVNDVLLICRASDEGHYLVNIANSGLYAIYAYDGVKKNFTRIADGGSNKIKGGKETNDYALVCNDKTITLYINGIETRKYTDNQFVFRKGQVAVGVASEDQVPVKVEFDWVKVSQP